MTLRTVRILLGLSLLAVSLALLAWAFWPVPRETLVVPIPPADLVLPTPGG